MAIACGVSRAGSMVMKIGWTFLASSPSRSMAALIVLSSVGQTSGQLVKPKKISMYLPLKSASVTVLPV